MTDNRRKYRRLKRFDASLTIGLEARVRNQLDKKADHRQLPTGELVRQWIGQGLNRAQANAARHRTRARQGEGMAGKFKRGDRVSFMAQTESGHRLRVKGRVTDLYGFGRVCVAFSCPLSLMGVTGFEA